MNTHPLSNIRLLSRIRTRNISVLLIFVMVFSLFNLKFAHNAAAALPIPSAGLDLWLSADAGITADAANKVSRWADQSGNGNDVTQDDPSLQPMLVTDAVYAPNGKPAIKFEEGFGNTPYLAKTLATPYLGSSSIIMVMKQNKLSPGNGKGIFGTDVFNGQDETGAFAIITDWSAGGLLVGGNNGNAKISEPSTDYAIISVTIDAIAGTVKSYVNGQPVFSGTDPSYMLFNKYAAYAIGRSYWYNSLDADLAEMMVYQNVISDTDREAVEQYLNDRYSIFATATPTPTPTPTSTPKLPIPSSGLNLWLSADSGITLDASNKVSSWADQSGKGNDVAQADQTLRPSVSNNAINGKPVVKFEEGIGNTPFLEKTLAAPYTGSSSIIMVMKQNRLGQGKGKGIFGTDTFQGQDMSGAFALSAGWDESATGGDLTVYGNDSNIKVGNATTDYVILSVTIDAGMGTIRSFVNGNLITDSTDDQYMKFNKYIKYAIGRSYWWNTLDANLAEIIVYRGVISDADRDEAEKYLNDKYAVYTPTVPTPTPKSQSIPLGLNLWLKADAGIFADGSGKVSQWSDQSGNDNHVTQISADYQPELIANAGNGLASVRFDGVNDLLSKKLSGNYTGNSTISMVLKLKSANNAGSKGIFATDTNSGQNLSGVFGITSEAGGSGELDLLGQAGRYNIAPASTSNMLLTVLIDSMTGNIRGYVNGKEVADQTSDNFKDFNKFAQYVLGRGVNADYLAADLSEVMVYRRVVTEVERQQIDTYLNGKYAIYSPDHAYPSTPGAVRILTLGDQITQGYEGNATYRYFLWHLLNENSYNVDFVGSKQGNYKNSPSGFGKPKYSDFDPDNEGHWGWTIDQINQSAALPTWIQGYTPDIALIHLGTADILAGKSTQSIVDGINQVIDTLRSKNPNVRITLAKLIPLRDSVANLRLLVLNSSIQGIADAKTSQSSPVVVADQYSGFDATADSRDGVIPNETGELKMATQWFKAIKSFLPSITPPAPSPAPAGYLSISAYGAAANDEYDDLAAITSCINAAKAQGKGVFVPRGTYNYSNLIPLDGVNMMGEGAGISILRSTNRNYQAVKITGSNVHLTDLSLTTVAPKERLLTYETARVLVFEASDFTIENITVDGGGTSGILMSNSTRGLVRGNTVKNTQADGIHNTNKTSFITIENNTVRGNGDDFISVVSYQIDGGITHDITIRNNDVAGNFHGRGITVIGGKNVTIEDNKITDSNVAGFMIAGEGSYNTYGVDNVLIQRNTLYRTGSSTAAGGHGAFHVYASSGTCTNITFANNVVYDSKSMGIHLNGGQTQGVTFDHNVFINTVKEGIYVDTSFRGAAVFTNNIFENTAAYGFRFHNPVSGSIVLRGNTFKNVNYANTNDPLFAGDSLTKDVIKIESGTLESIKVQSNTYIDTAGYGIQYFIDEAVNAAKEVYSDNSSAVGSYINGRVVAPPKTH